MDRKLVTFILAALFVSLVLAVALSPYASSSPDGLESIAEHHGFLDRAAPLVTWVKALAPDYLMPGVENEGSATRWSGLVGTLIVFVLAVGLGKLLALGNHHEISEKERR